MQVYSTSTCHYNLTLLHNGPQISFLKSMISNDKHSFKLFDGKIQHLAGEVNFMAEEVLCAAPRPWGSSPSTTRQPSYPSTLGPPTATYLERL